jgi:hypothetical protein
LEDAGISEKLRVTFIETPDIGSFSVYKEILEKIHTVVGPDKANARIVLSAGPASKVLVYLLSSKGYVAYDVGKGIEAMYRVNEIESAI